MLTDSFSESRLQLPTTTYFKARATALLGFTVATAFRSFRFGGRSPSNLHPDTMERTPPGRG